MGDGGRTGPTQLHEREKDLALLAERVAGLGGGSGSVVVIEGRAGAGKSALLGAGSALGRAGGHDVRAVRARVHERTRTGATIGRLSNRSDAVTSSCEIVYEYLARAEAPGMGWPAEVSAAEASVAVFGANGLVYVEATRGRALQSWLAAHIHAWEAHGGVAGVTRVRRPAGGREHAVPRRPRDRHPVLNRPTTGPAV